MRSRVLVIVFSLVSVVTVVVLGGFLNLITGFGFDVATPYNAPIRLVATLAGAAPGLIFGMIAMGYAIHDAARRSGAVWLVGLLAWPILAVLAAGLMFAGVLAHAELWFLPLAFVSLAALVYAIVASSAGAPKDGRPAASRSRLAAFVGVLGLIAIGGAVLLFPGTPSGGSVTTGTPALQVTQGGSTANCAGGVYPSIALTNTSAQQVQWTADTQDTNVTATPSSGSLTPGASATVTLSGATSAPDVIVQLRAGDQTAGVAKIGCQAAGG